tara:strand:- start:12693 stop:13484 length:792 start_codon:yes stop_codon:yes gene_type:complete
MFYKKKGFPSDGEIVVCIVKKILPTTVFVILDEFQNKEGIVHISEISPGRIRSIRDYVKENKKILCKVLRVNPERGSIDLSLRRATKSSQIAKNQEIKNEQKAEKVLEVLAHQLKKSLEDVYKLFGFKVVEEFGSLFNCFEEVLLEGDQVLTKIGVDKATAKTLTELIAIRMKPPEVKVAQKIVLKCKSPTGIEVIKSAINKALAFAKTKKYDFTIGYVGAPKYDVSLKAGDFKTAEKELGEVLDTLISTLKKDGGEGEVVQK